MNKKILRLPTVKQSVGYSTSNIYKLMSENKFPSSIKLGGRAVGWLQSDIEDWIDSRVAESHTSVTEDK